MQSLLFAPGDICAARHQGAETSVDAYAKVSPTIRFTHALILAYVRSRGEQGATSKEIARHLGKRLHAVSGRCSELVAMNRLRKNGLRRDGAAVLVMGERT